MRLRSATRLRTRRLALGVLLGASLLPFWAGGVAAAGAPPTVQPPDVQTAGGKTTLGTTFTDPDENDTHTGVIDWGDGSPPEPAHVTDPVSPGQSGTITGMHIYTRPGVYVIRLHVNDSGGQGADRQVNLPVTPRQAKEGVARRLQGLLPTGDKDNDKKISEALSAVRESLDPSLWAGPNDLDPKHGDRVFDLERKAVQKLRDLKTPVEGASALAHDLTDIDRFFAKSVVNDAEAGKDKDKAMDELSKGDAARNSGLLEQAIQHYRNAWRRITH